MKYVVVWVGDTLKTPWALEASAVPEQLVANKAHELAEPKDPVIVIVELSPTQILSFEATTVVITGDAFTVTVTDLHSIVEEHEPTGFTK